MSEPHIRRMMFGRAPRDSLSDLPAVETARLTVSGLAAEDAEDLRRLTDDPAITGAVDFLPTPFTIQDARDLIGGGNRASDRFLGVRHRAAAPGDARPGEGAQGLLGVVGAHLCGPGAIEVGYWMGGAARGRGYAFEAVSGLLGVLKARFPARAVVAECRPGNVASWGLLHKLGFRETGAEGHRPGRRLLERTAA